MEEISFLICEYRGRNYAFGYSLNLKQSANLHSGLTR
nr:MAG TPA_asm: hypothetical protein [Bacteriophage sp.]